MKKLLITTLAILTIASIVSADWIEPYGAASRNTGYWQKLNVNEIVSADGSLVARDVWTNLPAKSSTAVSGVAAIEISTAALQSGTSVWGETFIQGTGYVPRNIGFQWNIVFATNAFGTSLTVTGYDAMGNERSEVLIATCNAMTYTVWAYERVKSVKLGSIVSHRKNIAEQGYDGTVAGTIFDGGGLLLFVGTGDKIGLLGDIDASTDVKCAKITTANDIWMDETTALTVNADYNTWTLTDVPDSADDYIIIYTPLLK